MACVRSCLRRGHPAAAVLIAAVVLLGGCQARRDGASAPAPPDLDDVLPRCELVGSVTRPFVVEWKGTDRGELELALQSGPVVVRRSGCELEVLPRCRAPGAYRYAGFTRKHDTLAIHGEEDLYSSMPVGAATLAGTLARTGQLHLDMTIVGMLRVDASVYRSDLEGACEGATHAISGAHVGAFVLSAGERTELATHAGPARTTATETINADGAADACETATPGDTAAPPGCGAIVRLELAPLLTPGPLASALPVEPPAHPDEDEEVLLDDPPPGLTEPTPANLVAPATALQAPSPSTRDCGRDPRRDIVRFVGNGAMFFALAASGIAVTVYATRKVSAIDDELARHTGGSPDLSDPKKRRKDAIDSRNAGIGMIAMGIPIAILSTTLGALKIQCLRDSRGRSARVNVTPTVGRTYGGLAVTLRF